MKNNKGFTLVELMAVIVILAIIISIAVPSTIAISHKIKVKMYNTKVDMIMSSAKLYGQENSDKVNNSDDNCGIVTVEELIEGGYIKKDDTEEGSVLNPIDKADMKNYKICVYEKNNRIYAKPVECEYTWNKDNNLTKYCKP